MPITYEPNFYSSWIPHLKGLRTLIALLAAEGKLAEREGRTMDAVESYLDMMRFGQEISRGGLVVERLGGISCQGVGLRRLRRLLPTLNTAESPKISKAIEEREPEP